MTERREGYLTSFQIGDGRGGFQTIDPEARVLDLQRTPPPRPEASALPFLEALRTARGVINGYWDTDAAMAAMLLEAYRTMGLVCPTCDQTAAHATGAWSWDAAAAQLACASATMTCGDGHTWEGPAVIPAGVGIDVDVVPRQRDLPGREPADG